MSRAGLQHPAKAKRPRWASASSPTLALGFACATLSCSRPSEPPAPKKDVHVELLDDATPPIPPASDGEARTPDAGAHSVRSTFDAGSDPILPPDARMLGATPVSGQSVGHTSLVFKLRLDDGSVVAFKPRTHSMRTRYRGEVAAYRLARALGLSNVPRSFIHRFPAARLRAVVAKRKDESEAMGQLEPDTQGMVPGALARWIEGLEFLPLEKEPWWSRWRSWLSMGEVPEADRPLAKQIAELIIFDALVGNWDRWSGGNVGYDSKTKTLLFVDNDASFPLRLSESQDAQIFGLVRSLRRLPKGLLERLRVLDANTLASILGDESPGVPLVSAAAIQQVDERRKRIVTALDRAVATVGPGAFAFD